MEKINYTYKLYISGNDLDAKARQKLKKGDSLRFIRLDDAEDTFEIVITTQQGKELDMLSYGESIGIAPFLDEGNLVTESITVDEVVVEKGKTRTKDNTVLTFTVIYAYEEELRPVVVDDVLAFIPSYDIIQAMATYRYLMEEETMSKIYLNCYELDYPVPDGDLLKGDEDLEGENFSFSCSVLFNPEFTKCKISAKLYNEDIEYGLELPASVQESRLVLVNHIRIFEGNDPLECTIEG